MKISVIIPVYNVETLLDRCLASLNKQTFKEFEVLVINDGSTDSSESIIQKYVDEKPEVFKLINQENAGQSAARNHGVELAKGKYIYFLDSDDYIKPSTLRMMYDTAEMNKLDYVIDGFQRVDESGNYIDSFTIPTVVHSQVINPSVDTSLFLIHNSIWNRLYLKDIIVKNNLKFMSGIWYEDLLFGHQYYIYSQRAMVVNQQNYFYVQRPGSIMASMSSEKNLDIVVVFKELIDFYKKQGIYNQYANLIEQMAISEFYIATMVRLIRTNKMDIAKQIDSEFRTMFPNYKKNPGVKKLAFKHKIVYRLLNLKWYGIVRMIFK